MPKILVIDDDKEFQDFLGFLLESRGFEVYRALTADEGLNQTVSIEPDLIILDVMMPGKNGFEAMKEIRSDASTAGIPILVLTAIGEHLAHSRYARNMGLDIDSEDFITKPVDAKDLLGRVKAVLV